MAFRTNTISRAAGEAHLVGMRNRAGGLPWTRGLAGLFAVAVLGCGVADEGRLPPHIEDPATLRTPDGAIARYRATLAEFGVTFDGAMTVGGVLTDELAALPLPQTATGPFTPLDSRNVGRDTDEASGVLKGLSIRLHTLRAQAREGRGFLRAYAPESSPALGAHLAALEGYAELYLADLFCSGIPLSTVDFDGDFTLAAGSTTAEVYRHAADLFDTALTQASDSARVQHLAAVGRGRALLALGQYAAAAEAVTAVPDDYQYQVPFQWSVSGAFPGQARPTVPDSASLFWFILSATSERAGALSMGDQEGGVGLAYQSSGDPRTLPWTRTDIMDPSGNVLSFPRKYAPAPPPEDPNGVTPLPISPTTFTVASGVEARLIEAEAALKTGSGEWLTKLNALRTTGSFDVQPNAENPAVNDTLWHAGGGGVPGLRPLDDPGSETARVDLQFRERGFWLYLAAHRQGDLRRLIRQYLRTPDSVYPRGSYPGGDGTYGPEITVPVPTSERELNPKYTGCFHRNA